MARAGPDLAVRMGVGRAHRLAAVLEDLDVAIVVPSSVVWSAHEVDHPAHVACGHGAERQIVARREAHDATGARLALSLQQAVVEAPSRLMAGWSAAKSLVKTYVDVIGGVAIAVGADVARAQVARRVVAQR